MSNIETKENLNPLSYAAYVQTAWSFSMTEQINPEGEPIGDPLLAIRIESTNGSLMLFVAPDFAEHLGRQFLKNVKRMRKVHNRHIAPANGKLIVPGNDGQMQEHVVEEPDEETDAIADAILNEPDDENGLETEVASSPESINEIANRFGVDPSEVEEIE